MALLDVAHDAACTNEDLSKEDLSTYLGEDP